MRKLLVTGGAGFIGTNFVRYWTARHPDDVVVVLDALTYAGNRANLDDLIEAGRIGFVKGDICDSDLVDDLLTD
ncbi:MAG TPA: NAD-dependent epimerase/dehydratase family protein, partial [Alphaproteobacteria bacterium]|nr:NAD-dependent epimerase/dehydratase family protein [Alphaproteobacteria bacterium]